LAIAGKPGNNSPIPGRDFPLCHHIQTDPEAHPASTPVSSGVLSLRVNQLKCETDISTKKTDEVKNLNLFQRNILHKICTFNMKKYISIVPQQKLCQQ
jgi:hypothetical protein